MNWLALKITAGGILGYLASPDGNFHEFDPATEQTTIVPLWED